MTTIDNDVTLAEIVDGSPVLARKLEKLGLDYCCGGRRSLGDACSELGLDAAEVVDQLRDAEAAGAAEPAPWVGLGPAELVDYIEQVHHRYLHEEMPRLAELSAKVRSVHGDRHPELAEVDDTFRALVAELDPHLRKEEVVLFPAIRQLATGGDGAAGPGGSLDGPISVMLVEHDQAGDLLAHLRQLTNEYTVPADGCASYQALYEGMAALEADTHLHIHKENNRLFPMVLELEKASA